MGFCSLFIMSVLILPIMFIKVFSFTPSYNAQRRHKEPYVVSYNRFLSRDFIKLMAGKGGSRSSGSRSGGSKSAGGGKSKASNDARSNAMNPQSPSYNPTSAASTSKSQQSKDDRANSMNPKSPAYNPTSQADCDDDDSDD